MDKIPKKAVVNISGCLSNPISVLKEPNTSRYIISTEVV